MTTTETITVYLSSPGRRCRSWQVFAQCEGADRYTFAAEEFDDRAEAERAAARLGRRHGAEIVRTAND
jgi:hypothetical protein